ncbi:hypothetical protein GGF32_005949 [Allomyces javanicus]|nr:hypothetical protein GGF32_005949 [Allomyces javanicus]
MPFRQHETEFTPIDSDPTFGRVMRFLRLEDYGLWAASTAAAPATYYWVDMQRPTKSLPLGLKAAAALGFVGGFFLAYQQSSFRFWGVSENQREIEKDRAEFVAARTAGKEHHLGKSSLEPYLQGVSARHSRYTALSFSWLPWFNFVHHNQGVNWDLYKDLQTAGQVAN